LTRADGWHLEVAAASQSSLARLPPAVSAYTHDARARPNPKRLSIGFRFAAAAAVSGRARCDIGLRRPEARLAPIRGGVESPSSAELPPTGDRSVVRCRNARNATLRHQPRRIIRASCSRSCASIIKCDEAVQLRRFSFALAGLSINFL